MVHLSELPSRPLGVVLCNPLGYEALSVHRTYRHLAERLAAAGFAALRFDYDGTGDSAGRADGAGRVRAWIDGVRAAVAELRARAPHVRRIGLFGVRFGATLAAAAARELGGVDALVLWAPVSGRTHARELLTFAMVRASKGEGPMPTDGDVEVGGFFFARQTLADMQALDLGTSTERIAERVLLMPRTERGGEEPRWVEQLRSSAADVQVASESGYAGMMRDDPYDSVVPSAALDAVVEWMGRATAHVTSAATTALAAPPDSSASVIAVTASDGKGTLRETPLRFGDAERLFGVVTEPAGGVDGSRPAVCFLNVGADHHIGAHRMNVDLGRELAALGYLSMRFDAAGLGESLAAPGTSENRIYTKDAVADVKRAMDLLGRLHGARRFVLVGMCSGAYLAFHTTASDPRIAGQVLISSFAFEWKEGDPVAPTGRDPRRVVDKGRNNDVERAFLAMCERGVESLLVSASNDGGLDMIAAYLGTEARRMRGNRHFALEIVEDGDHMFTTLASQRALYGIVARYMSARFP
jgi:alpha-beta hydrolase superfamily lysophospholipase